MFARPHGGHLYFHACESEDAPRRFPFEQFYHGVRLFVEMKCESRKPDAVEEAFENSGHTNPPVGIEDDDMVGPPDVFLHGEEVRLKRLYLAVSPVQNGVEMQLADVLPLHLVARRARGALVGIGKLAGKSRKIRVPDEYENFTA